MFLIILTYFLHVQNFTLFFLMIHILDMVCVFVVAYHKFLRIPKKSCIGISCYKAKLVQISCTSSPFSLSHTIRTHTRTQLSGCSGRNQKGE